MAQINLGVQQEAETARQALDENNRAMRSVIEALEAAGIADKDLQTSGFHIQPRYFHPKPRSSGPQEPPKIIGYLVSNQLTIRVRDLDKLGEIIDRTVTLGVNSGGGVQFLNEHPEEALSEARTKAVADAIAKAKTLVEAAGVKLGRIMQINENSRMPRPMMRAEMSMAQAEAGAVPIAAGENSYQVNVQVQWEILQ